MSETVKCRIACAVFPDGKWACHSTSINNDAENCRTASGWYGNGVIQAILEVELPIPPKPADPEIPKTIKVSL